MTRIAVFDSSVSNPAAITTAYASGYAVAIPVGRSAPIVFFAELTGPTSLQFDISFSDSTDASNAPSAADDTKWFSLVTSAGATISTETSVVPGRSIVDLSSKLTDTASALVWKGWVPQGVGWLRVRVKRTGAAVTALKLTMVTDGRTISG